MKQISKKLIVFFRDKNKKPYGQIIKEVVDSAFREKEVASHYFAYHLYKKDGPDYRNFIGSRNRLKISNKVVASQRALVPYMANKLVFAQYLESQGFKEAPSFYGYNFEGYFYRASEEGLAARIEDREGLLEFLRELFIVSGQDYLFVKPISGSHGRGCHLLEKEGLDGLLSEAVAMEILTGSYIFQERLVQHQALSRVNPHAINSIRMDSYLDRRGQLNFLSAYIRFGASDSPIDNLSQGGILVPIDLEIGLCKKEGYRKIQFGGESLKSHPQSGLVFEGLEIPLFEEAKELIERLSRLIPYRLVGWDLAISEEGPMVIEANSRYNIGSSELAAGGYKNHPKFQQMLRELDGGA